MGIRFCRECQTVEGKTYFDPTDENEEFPICAECDSEDSIKRVPEHDDGDMER